MSRQLIVGSFIVFLMLSSVSAYADSPSAPLKNPFSRPPSERTKESRPVFSADGTVQTLDLRATMVTTSDRLANVAGRTLRLGDEEQGYTLLQVFEDRAVFMRAGKRVTIYVKPDLVTDDE